MLFVVQADRLILPFFFITVILACCYLFFLLEQLFSQIVSFCPKIALRFFFCGQKKTPGIEYCTYSTYREFRTKVANLNFPEFPSGKEFVRCFAKKTPNSPPKKAPFFQPTLNTPSNKLQDIASDYVCP